MAFQKGNKHGKGRKEGSMNLAKRIELALETSFINQGQADFLDKLAQDQPVAYANLLAKKLASEDHLYSHNAQADNLDELLTYLRETKK